MIPNSHKLFPKYNRREHFPTHSMRSSLHSYQTRQRKSKIRKWQTIIFYDYRHKNLQKNTSKQNPDHMKRIIYYDQVVFIQGMQGWLTIWNQPMKYIMSIEYFMVNWFSIIIQRQFNKRKNSHFNKWGRYDWTSTCKRMMLYPSLHHTEKLICTQKLTSWKKI